MLVVGALVTASIGVMITVVLGAWREGTLGETHQERVDYEFEQIVTRLRSGA